jgi:CubicO group peptidase (beta-lactamase class C family)
MLRAAIEADLQTLNVPGASWAVIENGEISQTGAAGVVQTGNAAPITADTLFQAASISKPIAVLAMLRLVDRGLLDLDQDVNERLTSWQLPPSRRWQPMVTLRQLASHRAGLTVPGFRGIGTATYCRRPCRSSTASRPRTPSASGWTLYRGRSSGTRVAARWSCSSYSRTSPAHRSNS